MHYSPRNFWLLIGLGMVMIMAAHLLPHAVRGEGLWSIPALGFGALMLLGAGLMYLSYGAMDDIQKQDLKSDWYWGSAIAGGVLVGLVFPYVLFGPDLDGLLLHGAKTSKGDFFSGVIVVLGLHAVGYVLARLFRRLRWMK